MTEEILKKNSTASAFLKDLDEPDQHIVDTLIEERCPSFAGHWSWPIVRPVLYSALGYRKARRMADTLMTLSGRQSFEYLSQQLNVSLDLRHLDRLPEKGRVVIAANHPTGLADGVAVWDAIVRKREDVVFFANADALRVNPAFTDVMIPIEWVASKRTPAKTRETLRMAAEAFEQEKCIVIFPSGKLAKKIDGELTEQEWFPTVVSLARKQKAPILPLHIEAANSWLFYKLSQINGELRDITLFHELLNKKRAEFDMAFGPIIPPERLSGDATIVTELLQEHVAYALGETPDLDFMPTRPAATAVPPA
ncbi:GNAT family N-acetyltransferase [Henriciella mobilis]|uniref:Acyltransferase n=1 Tax=Henriciella mobilis TaxID=2305467 RepID=A0A399RJV5_9PROT|nr:1-acyl-sn-glycerol-3-phosphate acyltransferase [Henriciella mobilis]RIJ17979.1 acyltransferase [Henriciella mobilis]RIJ25213.1 acyltransferase [Henriciella mobilis]RIJ30277.1 acyltransferase [Henriciella mobilis]